MSSIYTNGNDTYFYSNKVKVFPCAYRSSTYDATARLNTEYNFTHLPHMVDKASYIIEFTEEKLICAIQGYYFEIELGDGDYTKLNYNEETKKYKYLNICVASPNSDTYGENFIEGPHLCSWDSSDGVEATLDGKPEGSNYYIFKGLKIGEGALSNGSYQCYALKLDAGAMLPIMANKIENIIKNKEGVENSTGKPISREFTTDTLTANTSISTTSLNAKSLIVKNITGSTILEAHPSGITAYQAVQIKSSLTSNSLKSTSLNIETDSTNPILKAGSKEVTIHKPTTITGANSNLTVAGTGKFGGKLTVTAGGTDITGDTQIKKSSSVATDGNLTVAGRGSFGGELSVTADIDTGTAFTIGKVQQQNSKQQDLGKLLCADVEVPLFVKNNLYVRGRNIDIGNTSSVPNITIYGIQPKSNDTSTFANGELLKIDQVTGKIAVYGLRKAASDDETDTVGEIFSIDPKTGETFANKINATVEGTSKNAINAENVKTSINGKSITDIFETNGLVVQKASSLTATSSTDSAGNIIITGNTAGTVDALIPAKTTGRTYNMGSSDKTFDNIYATTFHGSLDGNANTATAFKEAASIILTGDVITTTAATGTHGWTVNTTIDENAVTTGKIAKSAVTEVKIEGGAVTTSKIAGSAVTNAKLAGGITNDKLVYDSITIGSTEVVLGGSVGDHESRRIGTLYGTSLNLSGDMLVNNIGNIKVNNTSLKSSNTIQVIGSTIRLLDSSLVVASGMITIGDQLRFNTSSGNIETNGTVEAASFNATSDRRLKENIIDYKPKKSILDLPIKKFDFIEGPKNQIGCIAQDLKEICPEIVNENEKGYLSIQESKLVYLLLDEVKKLKNEVEELKRK